MADRIIQLSISEAAAPGGRAFQSTLELDGQPITINEMLTVEQSDQVREIGETYEQLFLNRTAETAQLSLDHLRTIGVSLFDLWLAPHWARLAASPGARRILTIASALPEALNLPWELLRPPDASPIGTSNDWGLRRFPWPTGKPAPGGDLRPGPLRVLFFAASPRDLAELDFEREEEVLMAAVGSRVVVETALLGTFDELGDLLTSFEPHIVHLSGHGELGPRGASFFFEDDRGFARARPAAEVGERLSGNGVRCVFVSGCKAGSAPPRNVLGGVCQAVIAHGLPMAIGWAASIVDDIATTVAKRFYAAVSKGASVDFALAQARWSGWDTYGRSGDPSWSLPVLYASIVDTRILDKDASKSPPTPSRDHLQIPGVSYARYFVGRRREMQAVFPGLRDGSIRGVVLTGLAGVGKSSLATRLARKLQGPSAEEPRLRPIALTSRGKDLLASNAVLSACRTAFIEDGRQDAADRTANTSNSISDRLRVLVNDLSNRYVVLLDDFEKLLDDGTRTIRNPEIAEFYQTLLTSLVGTSRLLVTSRYLPADVDPLPDDIVEVTLGEFSQAAYLKFMYRETAVQRRYQTGGCEREVLPRLYELFGAAPTLMKDFRTALKDRGLDPRALLDDMDWPAHALEPRTRTAALPFETAYADFCSKVVSLDRIYGRLSAADQALLGRLAVYPNALSAADAAALTSRAETELQDLLAACRKAALTYPSDPTQPDSPWSTYGALRRWLTAPPRLSPDDARSAHHAAADHLLAQTGPPTDDRATSLPLLLQARSHFLAAGARDKARETTTRISGVLIERGEFEDIERLNEELLKDAEQAKESPHPEPATWIARTWLERSDLEKAREWYDKALAMAGGEHPREQAHALQGLATISMREGNNDLARKQFWDALRIQDAIEDRVGRGVTWHQLGSIDFYEEKYDDARDKFSRALSYLKGMSPGDEQALEHQLGSTDFQQDKLQAAKEAFLRAREKARELGNQRAEADALHQLGRTLYRMGDRREGLDLMKSALALRRDLNDRHGEALSFRRLAEIAGDSGDLDLALRLAMAAFAINVETKAETKHDAAAVERWRVAIGTQPEQVETIQGEVRTQYLADRGKALIKRLRARP